MSVSGPQSGIRFTGLSSGLDVESIVNQLMSLEQFPIQRMQSQQAQLLARQSIYSQFRSSLISLNSAASSLNIASNFKPNKATTSNEDVATVTATDSAVPGTYSIKVNNLASSHKITGSPQVSATDALNHNGSMLINGKLVEIVETDTLQNIAAKINSLNNGAAATVINGGTNQAYLVLGSTTSGKSAQLRVADVTGTIADSLGLTAAGSFAVSQTGTVAKSAGFASTTGTLQTQLGFAAAGSFTLGADVINYDTAADSLQDVVNRINATGNHTASIVSEQIDGVDKFRLVVDSSDIPAGTVDTNGFLRQIGMLQSNFGNEVVEAKDASVEIDGITISSKTNVVDGAVAGLKITLVDEGESTLEVIRDTASVKGKIKSFQDAYNNVVEFIRSNSAFDSETFESGALFGDATAAQVENTLSSMLFNNVGSGTYRNLAAVGFSVDDKGKLTLDESKLDSALNTNPEEVRRLMMSTGTTTSSQLGYVGSSNKTVPSGSSGYAVEITQLATKGTVSGSKPFDTPAVGGEILTFSGTLFGSKTIDLSISAGATLASLISQINSDSRLKDLVTASDDGGTLKLESRRYGTPGAFTVVSNQTESNDNSGIGTTGGVPVAGLDIAGTINGEEATGNGQFLLGKTGNLKTEGLQVQYTGSTLGVIGSVTYFGGVSNSMGYSISSFTDSVNGLLTSVDKTLTSQVDDIQDRIDNLTKQLTLREDTLRKKFTAMEQAIARLNSQGSQLGAILGTG